MNSHVYKVHLLGQKCRNSAAHLIKSLIQALKLEQTHQTRGALAALGAVAMVAAFPQNCDLQHRHLHEKLRESPRPQLPALSFLHIPKPSFFIPFV
jgi:glycerol dehydrogenase-like iron-containing ADH family enzyme